MIILEGPDGGGKSSLAQRISVRFGLNIAPRASDSIDGPVKNLTEWVTEDLKTWSPGDVRIYDRYPLISEPIYGPICRRGEPSPLLIADFLGECLDQFVKESLVIFCIPPLSRVKEAVSTVPQMEGVRDNIALIWRAYDQLSRDYTGTSVLYDYTWRDRRDQESLLSGAIQQHLEERLTRNGPVQ